ncbi:MAG: archaellin/type IV pilin N-terminal domain-containing protein [Candidatus Nanosalina sp.]
MKRKGITPVIATSLLILIAVSSVSAAAVFLRDTTGDITGSVNDRLSEQKRIEGTSISVERGYNNSDSDISLRVRNTGRYVILVEGSDNGANENKKWSLYVDGKPRDFTYSRMTDPNRVALDAGETITIDTGIDYPTAGNYKRLTIQGRYETESGIVCSNSGGSQNC